MAAAAAEISCNLKGQHAERGTLLLNLGSERQVCMQQAAERCRPNAPEAAGALPGAAAAAPALQPAFCGSPVHLLAAAGAAATVEAVLAPASEAGRPAGPGPVQQRRRHAALILMQRIWALSVSLCPGLGDCEMQTAAAAAAMAFAHPPLHLAHPPQLFCYQPLPFACPRLPSQAPPCAHAAPAAAALLKVMGLTMPCMRNA